MNQNKLCIWIHIEPENDKDSEFYKTTCGHELPITGAMTNTEIDFGFKYCPFCGKSILERGSKKHRHFQILYGPDVKIIELVGENEIHSYDELYGDDKKQ